MSTVDTRMLAGLVKGHPGVASDYLEECGVGKLEALQMYATRQLDTPTLGEYLERIASGTAERERAQWVQAQKIDNANVYRWSNDNFARWFAADPADIPQPPFVNISLAFAAAEVEMRHFVLCGFDDLVIRHNVSIGDIERSFERDTETHYILGRLLQAGFRVHNGWTRATLNERVPNERSERYHCWHFWQDVRPVDLLRWWRECDNPLGLSRFPCPVDGDVRFVNWLPMRDSGTAGDAVVVVWGGKMFVSKRCCNLMRHYRVQADWLNGPFHADARLIVAQCYGCHAIHWWLPGLPSL